MSDLEQIIDTLHEAAFDKEEVLLATVVARANFKVTRMVVSPACEGESSSLRTASTASSPSGEFEVTMSEFEYGSLVMRTLPKSLPPVESAVLLRSKGL